VCALFVRVVELREAPVDEPQQLPLVVDHHLHRIIAGSRAEEYG